MALIFADYINRTRLRLEFALSHTARLGSVRKALVINCTLGQILMQKTGGAGVLRSAELYLNKSQNKKRLSALCL